MADFEEAILAILQADAVAGPLGVVLDYGTTTKPNVLFHGFPPTTPFLPLVTYRISAESGFNPRHIYLDFIAWDETGEKIKPIQTRIYDLLHQHLDIVTTDWAIKGILYDSSGPLLYDNDFKCFWQRARYKCVVWRLPQKSALGS